MLLSLSLIKKYIDLPKSITPDRLALDLTEKVVEVEEVIDKGKDLDNIVVGKVEKVEKHSNADKLRLAWVDIQETKKSRNQEIKKPRNQETKESKNQEIKLVKVVCGGTNLEQGMLVAFAKVGAMVKWHGEGKLVKLEKVKIRGEESEGMICAADEIGLEAMFPHEKMEITDLTKFNLKVGEPMAKALGLNDVILEIDNKSITNRPDLWSHYGMAREIGAIYNLKLKTLELHNSLEIISNFQVPSSKKNTSSKFQTSKNDLSISIKDKDLCSRYIGCVVENIKVEESPEWLKKQLLALGMKPINNVVDITNYVLVEVGQPLHAFDKSKAKSQKPKVSNIIVRRAKKGERLVTLDEKKRELDEEMLIIAGSKEPIALAGVMGGLESGVTNNTKSIILESASFNAINIRQTSQKLGLRTEASARFEKGLHSNLAEIGMQRALQLIQEIIPGAEIGGVIDNKNKEGDKIEVQLSLDFIQDRIGERIDVNEVKSILNKLGFGIEIDQKSEICNLILRIPWWRSTGDIEIAEDIVEEIARVYGYDKIKPKMPQTRMNYVKQSEELKLIKQIRDLLSVGCGMMEVYNYSFLPKEEGEGGEIELENPLSREQAILRSSLLPGLLKNVRDNSRFYDKFKLFEIGRIFLNKAGKYSMGKDSKERLFEQPYHAAGVAVGGRKDNLYLEVKGIVQEMTQLFNCSMVNFEKKGGWIKEIEDGELKKFGIKNRRVFMFEIDLARLISEKKDIKKYQPLPKYPSIVRDLAVEVGYEIKWGEILEAVEQIDKLVKRVEFLSVYDLGNSMKSVAFRTEYRSDQKTLTDEEVIKIEKKILEKLEKNFQAKLRN